MIILEKIKILTFKNGFERNGTIFYPIIKWRRELKKEGYDFTFSKNYDKKTDIKYDYVFIDSRYIRKFTVLDGIYLNKDFIKEYMEEIRKNDSKIIFFENGDSTESRHFDLIEYVDSYVKKQVLKDRLLYANEYKSFKVYAWNYDLSQEEKESLYDYFSKFQLCPINEIHKIKIGWNIGMEDYRIFPFKKYYPIGTERILNSIYRGPFFAKSDIISRKLHSSFRGQVKEGNKSFSFQRNTLIEYFKNSEMRFITGSKISKLNYLKELRSSQICISPFGWGEICYRDFEAAIVGCLLIKPSMEHLETWPNIFRKDETYIPINWNMSDLSKVIENTLQNIEAYAPIAEKFQKEYREFVLSPVLFIKKFKELLDV